MMKLLEIIAVRTSGHFAEQARQYLKEFCQTLKGPPIPEMNFYINSATNSDISVILQWQEREQPNTKTDVGFSLASGLKRFGLVDHTCWVMMED
ncbi:MAG: hypothetical protein ABIK92_16440 [Pseudomonadota bacterium]